MRRNLCRFSYSAINPTFNSSSATAFYSSAGASGRGRGLGLGRGSTVPNSIFTSNNDDSISREPSQPPPPSSISREPLQPPPPLPPPSMGHGRGRGQPLASSPIIPKLNSFIGDSASPGPGRGRGTIAVPTPPTIGRSDDSSISDRMPSPPTATPNAQHIPPAVMSVVSGAGRGKPSIPQSPDIAAKPKQENRHIQHRPPQQDNEAGPRQQQQQQQPQQRRVPNNLADGGVGGRGSLGERYTRGRGSEGMRGRGGRGRGDRGRGRGRGQGRGQDLAEKKDQVDNADGEDSGPDLGDDPDGERLAKTLGPLKMDILVEAFEEVCSKVLPAPKGDAYVDALHTKFSIEQPEYLMENFGTNPDIDEKPPIPLRDVLEKMKPFLMAYKGIQSQEEWEAIIEDLMKREPLLERIVDYYSGPARLTAKQQRQELERVATTLPASTPTSLKRFANNAVLSLQSNPGWGFDKKCQLMDMLVREVSQNYK